MSEEIKDKVVDVKNQALNKADELYNKLPLDMINEKLGGKIDVKSRQFKLIAGGVFAVIVILLIVLVISLFSTPSLTDEEINELKDKYKFTAITDIEFEEEDSKDGWDAYKFKATVTDKKGEKTDATIIVYEKDGKREVLVLPRL